MKAINLRSTYHLQIGKCCGIHPFGTRRAFEADETASFGRLSRK